jgi:hypothetical protein
VTLKLVFEELSCLSSAMLFRQNSIFRLLFIILYLVLGSTGRIEAAGPKAHFISFGKWTTVQWHAIDDAGEKPLAIKVRALIVDGHIKEFTVGAAHEITDRLFVVQRAFRVNDSLPQDANSVPQWQWVCGGWLLVDRTTGHIAAVNLPELDSWYSAASWYRDYVAYCGISDDDKKIYAVVAQIGRRKPVLRKMLISDNAGETSKEKSASPCNTPVWQRTPTRVTFQSFPGEKHTFAIRGHVADVVTDNSEDDDEGSK